ncbi:MAG: APC family permease, partial [Gemmatimonadota bacterium]|nr:APC family permease [Gemmatimonadota bacterium]
FTLLIRRGARESGRAQTLTSFLKFLALLVLVVACLLAPRAVPSTAPVAVPVGAALFGAIVIAMQGVIYTYDGWNGILYFSEEVRDPGRDIPRAMLGGVLSVAAIYLLLNFAFAWVLTVPRMGGEPLVAAAAARATFGGRAYAVVSALTIVMLLSAVNALILIGSRVPVAMSRDGLFPASAANVDAKGTPTVALTATAVVALLFIVTGAFNAVLALAAFYFVLQYLVSFSALFYLRRREPDAPRPYRAWGYPWTTALVLIGSLAFLAGAVASDTKHSLWALALLVASYPVYRFTRVARP